MPTIQYAYGAEHRFFELEDARLGEVYMPPLHYYLPRAGAGTLIQNALAAPVGAPPLSSLAKGKRRIVVLTGGADSPAPARLTLPPLLACLREGSPDADIRVLAASGTHGPMTRDALLRRFGAALLEQAQFLCHDCDDADMLAEAGTLPSGGVLRLNRHVTEAELLVAEGVAAPHYMAGFSGASMRVLPGAAGRESALAAFSAAAEKPVSAGVTEGNPLYADVRYAAQAAGLSFTLNVSLNLDKDVVFASAGGADETQAACERLLRTECAVKAGESALTLASAGGEPFDRTFWGALRTLAAAEQVTKAGGTVILAARCGGGIGAGAPWQRALLARMTARLRIFCVSDAPEEGLRSLGVTPAASVEDALAAARLLAERERLSVIPDGTAVIFAR